MDDYASLARVWQVQCSLHPYYWLDLVFEFGCAVDFAVVCFVERCCRNSLGSRSCAATGPVLTYVLYYNLYFLAMIQCDYTSRCSSNLKTHKRRHDKSKSFVCSSCSYATNSEAMYRSHMFVHTSPESDNLGTLMGETARTPAVDHVLDAPQPGSNGLSTDGTPSAMTDYLSPTGADGPNSPLRVLTAVTDSKVFKCRHCDHTSNDRSNIRVHERTHVPGGAGKPFKCPHCDYRASQRVHMVLHVRRRHGEDAVAALPSPSLMRSVICVPMPPPTVLPQPEVDDIDYEALVRAETATGGPMLITVTPRGATLGQYGGTFGSSGVNGLGVLPLLQSAPTNVMTV